MMMDGAVILSRLLGKLMIFRGAEQAGSMFSTPSGENAAQSTLRYRGQSSPSCIVTGAMSWRLSAVTIHSHHACILPQAK